MAVQSARRCPRRNRVTFNVHRRERLNGRASIYISAPPRRSISSRDRSLFAICPRIRLGKLSTHARKSLETNGGIDISRSARESLSVSLLNRYYFPCFLRLPRLRITPIRISLKENRASAYQAFRLKRDEETATRLNSPVRIPYNEFLRTHTRTR